jgi:sulfur-carrier protein adenylyltransferase/sulfurtransferase
MSHPTHCVPELDHDMAKSGHQLVSEAKSKIREVTPGEAMQMQGDGAPVVFLDVRDLPEVNLGKIPGAVHVSRGNLETKIEAAVPRDARVVIYCASGNRSALAAVTMQEMGYSDVRSLSGGIRGWAAAGGDIDD